MTGLRHHLRLPWFVLAAIVGMLSVAGEASACSIKAASKAARSCCTSAPASACCCETPGPGSSHLSRAPSLIGNSLAVPNPTCECRPGTPGDPAPKPASPSSERRTDQGRVESVDLTHEVPPSLTFARIVLPANSPPKTPLYLRTSRLLI